jgi:hypothetical protein
MNCRQP